MSALTLGGTDIPIAPDGHREIHNERGQMTRSASGYLRSNVTAVLGRLKTWRFRTPPLSTNTATVRTALQSITTVTAAGYLIGASTSVLIRNVDESEDQTARFTTFTFELHQVSQ